MADKLTGCLLGGAVGDVLGLPREGLSRRRALRLFGPAPLRYRFVFGRGMVSDDTELACLAGQALLASGGDVERFAHSLAWRLRGWLLTGPAGIGLATLKATLKLLLGCSPERSGVPSAGNGPATRAPLLGVAAGDNLLELLRASTRLTHTDPRAEQGALCIALAARYGAQHGPVSDPTEFLATLVPHITDADLQQKVELIKDNLLRDSSVAEYAVAIGVMEGVSGFINHTVPVALYCWLRYPADFRRAVEEVILLGGDADTTGAIVGGLMGATLGANAIPQEWLDGLVEWPRSVRWMRRFGERLAAMRYPEEGNPAPRPLPLFWPGILPRNIIFTAIVLLHGFRRLLPPY